MLGHSLALEKVQCQQSKVNKKLSPSRRQYQLEAQFFTNTYFPGCLRLPSISTNKALLLVNLQFDLFKLLEPPCSCIFTVTNRPLVPAYIEAQGHLAKVISTSTPLLKVYLFISDLPLDSHSCQPPPIPSLPLLCGMTQPICLPEYLMTPFTDNWVLSYHVSS